MDKWPRFITVNKQGGVFVISLTIREFSGPALLLELEFLLFYQEINRIKEWINIFSEIIQELTRYFLKFHNLILIRLYHWYNLTLSR
jgi:hypothetical protein